MMKPSLSSRLAMPVMLAPATSIIRLISPPVGLNVFVLKAAAPTVPMTVIFRGILLLAILAIVLLRIFPQIALFILSMM
jgi:TRAP-type C4-dicarboxylate transport system permease large subunit